MMDYVVVDDTPAVSGQMIIIAMIVLAFTATTQRSLIADYCGLSDIVFHPAWTPQRASPVICLLDTIGELALLSQHYLRSSASTTASEGSNGKSGSSPLLSPAQTQLDATSTRWRLLQTVLILASLPTSIAMFACGGIPVTQACVAIYIVSILIHAFISSHTSIKRQTKHSTADAVAAQVFAWHLIYSMPIWTAAGWHVTTPLLEKSGLGDIAEYVRFGIILCELVLLLSAAALPCLPRSWRPSTTALLFSNIIFGVAMLSSYSVVEQQNADGSVNKVVVPKAVWEFAGFLTFGATTALLVPFTLSLALSISTYWLLVSPAPSIYAAGYDEIREDKTNADAVEHSEGTAQHTLPGDGGQRSWAAYRAEVFKEFMRIVSHSIYIAKGAEMFVRWYIRLVPEIRWVAFLIFNLLTSMVYYGFVYTGQDTTAPSWLVAGRLWLW